MDSCRHDPDYVENDEVTADEHARECLRQVFCGFCDNWIDSREPRVANIHRTDPEDAAAPWCAGSSRDEDGVLVLRQRRV